MAYMVLRALPRATNCFAEFSSHWKRASAFGVTSTFGCNSNPLLALRLLTEMLLPTTKDTGSVTDSLPPGRDEGYKFASFFSPIGGFLLHFSRPVIPPRFP